MIAFVLDASVAAKWAVPSAKEPLTLESLQLLKRYTAGEINFIVPDVFWAEVGNVLWKGVRQRRWPQAVAERAARDMKNRNFFTVSSLELLGEALEIALAHDRSIYDCLYVALAEREGCELVTADDRLIKNLQSQFPFILPLSSMP